MPNFTCDTATIHVEKGKTFFMLYTTIIHAIRKKLGLTCNEYCVLDMIYRMQNNDMHWCYASKEYMGKSLDLSKQTILTIIKNLMAANLVIQHDNTKWLQVSKTFIDAMEFDESRNFTNGKETLPNQSRNLTEFGKETLLNNKIINKNKNNNINKEDFINLVYQYKDKLGANTEDFIAYWTEASKSGKMRYEMEKFFDINRRINTWIKNTNNYGNKVRPNNTSQERIDNLKKWIYS